MDQLWAFLTDHAAALGVVVAALGVLVALGAWLWPGGQTESLPGGGESADAPALSSRRNQRNETTTRADPIGDTNIGPTWPTAGEHLSDYAKQSKTITDFEELRSMPAGSYILQLDPGVSRKSDQRLVDIPSIVVRWMFFSLSITLLPFGLTAAVLTAAGQEPSLVQLVGRGELFLIAAAMGAASFPPILESRAPVTLKLFLGGMSVIVVTLGAFGFTLVAAVTILMDVKEVSNLVRQSGLLESVHSDDTAIMSVFFAATASLTYLASLVVGDT